MKNLNSLMIVLCLLIVLGCKCQSDLFDQAKKETPTPSAASSPTASPTSTPKEDEHSPKPSPSETPGSKSSLNENPRLATGTYTGKCNNVTYNQTGDLLLRIDSVDSAGNVKAYFEASNGLKGKADLEGTVSSAGKLELSGTMNDGQSVAVSSTVAGNTISGGFGLADSKLKTQSGNFTVRRR